MSTVNVSENFSRVKLYATEEGRPWMLHSSGVHGSPLRAFGIGASGSTLEEDDHFKWKPYWASNSTIGYDVGEASTNIILGDHFSRATFFYDWRFNRRKGALSLVMEGGFYDELTGPCPAQWVLRMNRNVDDLAWMHPSLHVGGKTLDLHPRWNINPGDVTAAISLAETGNKPVIVWGKNDGTLGIYSLASAFDGRLLPVDAADEKEDKLHNFRGVPFDSLPEFAGMINPVVRRGKRFGRALADGLPLYFVSAKWWFLEKFGISKRDRRELTRYWLTADSFDGKDWFNLRLTRERDSYLPIAYAGEEAVSAAHEVTVKPKKTKKAKSAQGDESGAAPTVEPSASNGAAGESSGSASLPDSAQLQTA